MVKVEGGTFTMGAIREQIPEALEDEEPTHKVTLSSFMIGKYEVTQELWEGVMGSNPSIFKGSKQPVQLVKWYEVIEFCNILSERQGLTPAYTINKNEKDPSNNSQYDEVKWMVTCDFNANGYRLPTEAEWEYAARGGIKSFGYVGVEIKYSGSNSLDEVGWYGAENKTGNRESTDKTSEVGKKQPNELGLYDMSGNVWEWCWDWYGEYTSSSQTDPKGPNSGSFRVMRGGSWLNDAENCRVAFRDSHPPSYRKSDIGFRLVRTR